MKKKFPFQDLLIIETKHFTVAQDWETPIPGFFIIAPKRIIRSIADFDDKEAAEFIVLLCKVRKLMQNTLGIETVRPIMEYAKANMITPAHIKEVELYVKKIKEKIS